MYFEPVKNEEDEEEEKKIVRKTNEERIEKNLKKCTHLGNFHPESLKFLKLLLKLNLYFIK